MRRGLVSAQLRLQLVDAGEQLAGQHRGAVAQAKVAAQPNGLREARGGVGRELRVAGGVQQTQAQEPTPKPSAN